MSRKLSRREFIGVGAGVTVAASLGGASAFGKIGGGGRPTIPPGLLGVQQFSLRDATARLAANYPTSELPSPSLLLLELSFDSPHAVTVSSSDAATATMPTRVRPPHSGPCSRCAA